MTSSRARICAVALLVALAVGACGSGGDNASPTGAKGRYVAQVDPVCKELQGKLGELGKDPAKQAAEIFAALEKIKAVARPAEDSEIADLFRAALENVALSLQDVDQSRIVKDQARTDRALAGVRANVERVSKAAKSYGMTECAQTL